MLYRRSLIAASLVAALPARAQAWPTKPIKLVVPYAPGGTTDVIARMIAEHLGQRLGQNIIVDNKPGKGAMVGTALVAKAAPDGYTLLMSVISGLSISPTLYGGADFNPMGDFIHVSLASRNPSVLVVNPGFSARTFQEYVDYAKANPGKLAFATSGAGSSNHLLGARLEQVIGAALVHVPYRGAGPAMVDTIAGNVPSMFDSLPSAAPHIKAGKVRALAVSGEQRSPAFPDVPTMKEQGFPDLISYSWFGISVPAKTPQTIVDRLAKEMQAVLKEPAVVKRWEEIGAEGSTMTPAEFSRFVQAEIDKWTPVVKASGARPD
ncbi:MAG: Bug family tripartite tricarboxylate transporter substrate binding protein [Reyranella sp.]|uniref:Bug family tripartite tricarboxylate transporter substrate binding protein n=1 Tax=Reyranella sp. TaxID=1929291 RepID=UPI003D0C16FB